MCTLEKRGNIYILTIGGNNEHRLNPTLISLIKSKLSEIQYDYIKYKTPSALITTSEGKFFSNGYDLAWANSTSEPMQAKMLMDSMLRTLVYDLMNLPMPTIAAIGGHASAAGLILAMSHDYIVMRRDRGFLYMSELDIGLVIPKWFMEIVNVKIGCPKARRAVVLTAEKVVGERGREIGLVDVVVDGAEDVLVKAEIVADELVKRGWDGEVYKDIRRGLFKEVLDCIGIQDEIRSKL